MVRYVVMKDRTLGTPVYIARDESDAAKFLDEVQLSVKNTSYKVERSNSLTLSISGHTEWSNYYVVKCKTWEVDTTPQQIELAS